MSQANVDRLVECTEAFNRMFAGPEAVDDGDLRTFLGGMDPGIAFEPQQATLQGGYVGHEGVRQWLADVAEHYAPPGQLDYADLRDLGDRVLALGTLRYTGRGSGIETRAPVAIVARFRNGLMTEFKDYGDEDWALEAVRLTQ